MRKVPVRMTIRYSDGKPDLVLVIIEGICMVFSLNMCEQEYKMYIVDKKIVDKAIYVSVAG